MLVFVCAVKKKVPKPLKTDFQNILSFKIFGFSVAEDGITLSFNLKFFVSNTKVKQV